jgi:hypothetical protein
MAHQGALKAVGVVVQFGETGTLGADESVTEDVVAVPPGAGDPFVVDGQH